MIVWQQEGGEYVTSTGKPRLVEVVTDHSSLEYIVVLKRVGGPDDKKSGIPRMLVIVSGDKVTVETRAMSRARTYTPHGEIVWATGERVSLAR